MNDVIPEGVQKTLEERFGSRFVRHAAGGIVASGDDAVASVYPESSRLLCARLTRTPGSS
jgi:hypothetical protein